MNRKASRGRWEPDGLIIMNRTSEKQPEPLVGLAGKSR